MGKYVLRLYDEATGEDIAVETVETGMPEFLAWWLTTAASDYAETVPKIEEYGASTPDSGSGSADLRLIGEGVAELLNFHGVSDALKQELGCWFYLHGKVARCIANYKQGKAAKADTLFDIGIYAKMMRRIQATGNWP